jgi:hypothetical protein
LAVWYAPRPGVPPTLPPIEDDVTAALASQHRQRGLGHVDHAEQVGLDLCTEALVGSLLQRTGHRVPGVVDDDIECFEGFDRHLHGVAGRGGVGDVEPDRPHTLAVLVDDVVELVGSAGGGDDMVAVLEYGQGQLLAEAAGSTGDQPCLRHEVTPVDVVRRLDDLASYASYASYASFA